MHFLIFKFQSWRKQSAFIFGKRLNLSKIWAFCHFVTYQGLSGSFTKQQNDHNSPGWPLITKISALSFLHLSKLKKIKCLYFLDPTSFEGDMSFLSFCDFWEVFWYLHKLQNYHNSPGWTLVMKMSALFILQLLKLKKIKCLYFLDQMSFDGEMTFFKFFDLWEVFRYLCEITKSQRAYISLKWYQIQKIKALYFLHL